MLKNSSEHNSDVCYSLLNKKPLVATGVRRRHWFCRSVFVCVRKKCHIEHQLKKNFVCPTHLEDHEARMLFKVFFFFSFHVSPICMFHNHALFKIPNIMGKIKGKSCTRHFLMLRSFWYVVHQKCFMCVVEIWTHLKVNQQQCNRVNQPLVVERSRGLVT